MTPYNKEYYDMTDNYAKNNGHLKRIIWKLPISKNDKVLDVGCGKGYLVRRLRLNKIDAVGTDTSEFAGTLIPGFFTQADSKHLPFKKKEFDLVISTDVFEHIPEEDVVEVYKEMKRVGKKVFALICTKRGTQATHITVHPIEWWRKKLKGVEII